MSDVSVDIIKNRSGEAPDLPSGANLSGVSTAATLQVTNLNPTHINTSGVTTATTFSGSLKSTGTPTLGLGVTINSSGLNISGVATAGIVSATTLYGDGSNLTGVAMSIAPISYNPDVSDSTVSTGTGIGITFTERVIAGSGNVTLRIAGAAGTVVENFGVGNSVTINQNKITIDPTSDLTAGDTYYISYPSGAFTNTGGDVSYVGTAYTFGAKPIFTSLFRWGRNTNGQLGQNSTVNRSSPVQVTGATWRSVQNNNDGGNLHNTATKQDGTLWSWGMNEYGELGQNQAEAQLGGLSSPTQIPGTTWTVRHTHGYKSTLAVKTDGTLWSWGENGYGRLGLNNTTKYSSPVQIPGTTWSTADGALSGGHKGVWAIKTDGTLWAWGSSSYGNLGQNNLTNRSSPTQIPGTTWSKVSSVSYSTYAIKTDGTLWSWGLNKHGELGHNNRGTPSSTSNSQSSPTQIPGTTWSDVASGNYLGIAIKTDGTLWTWGSGADGRLGQNSTTFKSSPVQVPGTTWASVAADIESAIAIKTDGTLWSWGNNNYGALGLNSTVKYSSPVQIPGTTWSTENHHIGTNNTGFAVIQQEV